MSTPSDLQAVIDTAVRSTSPAELEPGKVYAFRTPDGIRQVDLTGEEYRTTPARKRGTTTVRDAASFGEFWQKHAGEHSEVYADADKLSVTAVLNADSPDVADWGDHRLRLELRETDAWKQWARLDGQLVGQEQFAEFVEDHLPEILEPAAAEMLEIAQSIQGTVKAEFASGTRLATGQRQLAYTETVQTKAGQKGNLVIPETFVVGLVPFEGSDGYRITARLRYRIEGNGLKLGYKLDRPQDVRRKAFDDVVAAIAEEITPPIFNGTPAGR
jgi:uncharacterized protein YfdQ (DUF2303 family)